MFALVVPHNERDVRLSDNGDTTTLPSSTFVDTWFTSKEQLSSPNLPLTVTILLLISTVTPAGITTGYLPILDFRFLP